MRNTLIEEKIQLLEHLRLVKQDCNITNGFDTELHNITTQKMVEIVKSLDIEKLK